MTQLGGQAELIESRKERQISGAGNEERGGGWVAVQHDWTQRKCWWGSSNSGELQLHSWRCFNELLPNESIEHSSSYPYLPCTPPRLPHTTISRLWGQLYGMVGGVAWRWIIALRWLIKWHFNEFTGKRDLPHPPFPPHAYCHAHLRIVIECSNRVEGGSAVGGGLTECAGSRCSV